MLRTFAEHCLRPVQSLDGLWDFLPECDRAVRGKTPKSFTRKIECPSAWESIPDLSGYRGTAWYHRRFHVTANRNVRLVFGGVSHTATVFVDGKEVGGHYDAFTPWEVLLTGLKPGVHDLTVKVDNSFGEHSSLHIPNDYYTYGGITRPVELHLVPELFLDKIFAVPKSGKNGWSLQVRLRLRNLGESPQGGVVRFSVAGQQLEWSVPAIPAGETAEVQKTLGGLEVEAWSETNPRLYDMVAELFVDGNVVDDKIDRIGFREVKVKGKQLLLNGEPLHLRGFNRHEDHPMYGCAVPAIGLAQDLDLFRDLNCNFLRTCHYPNDMRILDMCDERGIYVWEESHSRQTPFDPPNFDSQIRQSTLEMVENHFNHACIVMWGTLNECDTASDRGFEVHGAVLEYLRGLDASRPVTYAGHLRQRDRCTRFADIVSWNLYTGWYGGQPEKTLAELEELMAWLDSDASGGGKGKPVIVSEFGAGAIYGCRNPRADPWSEEWQCVVLDEALKAYLHHPRVVGAAIWQFSDVRVTREGNQHTFNAYSPMGRPRCMNNKGVVDEYRRPKLSYETVKAHMRAAEKKRGRI